LSTGPKTASGKQRSARNATRLGLSLPIVADPRLSRSVKELTDEIAGDGTSATVRDLASRIAEPQVDLARIRRARYAILAGALRDDKPLNSGRCDGSSGSHARDSVPQGAGPPGIPNADSSKSNSPSEVAAALREAVHQLTAIRRYERRTLSRRKFAIRMLKAAR